MKMFLFGLTIISLGFIRLTNADTGDQRYTGSIRVDGEIDARGTLAGSGWNLSIDSAKVAALAINSEKIAKDAVNAEKILALAVESGKIGALAIDSEKIAKNAVQTEKIMANTIDTSKLNFANIGTVNSGKIVCILSGANPLKKFGTCTADTLSASLCLCE